ncbi:MAG: hypothetical protein AAF438_03620 [Pseudomonadota bacterium]
MKLPRIKTVLLFFFGAFALFYVFGAVMLALRDDGIADFTGEPAPLNTVVIFGASGTTGDGILKAVLADDRIKKAYVITRRLTPRIEVGVAAGQVEAIIHTDYLNYEAIESTIAEADGVFWAIGISAIGVDEKTYGMIHVDFPEAFLKTWIPLTENRDTSFQFISSSDISEDSSTMWVREKIRAERVLFGLARGTRLKVIAHRPDYIGPTEEEAHLGQDLLYWFFAPVGAAVRAQQIGQAMLEIGVRLKDFENGSKVGTRTIILHSDAYERRSETAGQ